MLIYLASPYTIGDQAENVRRQFIAGDKILEKGHVPFCSLLTHFWHVYSPKEYATWIMIDTAILSRCDAVLRLNGISAGADREVTYALQRGIKVYFDIEDIPTGD